MRSRRVLRTIVTLLVLQSLVAMNAAAQADLNCDDFADQLEAQLSLNSTYPEDPNGLDADEDWIACEDYFELTDAEETRVIPADLASRGAQPTAEPPTEPASAPAADDSAPLPVSTSTGTSSRVDPPADLMTQVASCEVVAVSSRSIAAAGCPGVGSLVLRPPAGTPRMRSQVIIRPGAAFRPETEQVATAAQVASHDEPSRKRDRDPRERPRKKRNGTEDAASRLK
jgi:hypothetical protein